MSKQKQKKRGQKTTSVCPDCRVVVRSVKFAQPVCPKCQRPTLLVGDKYRVPPKGDTAGWKQMVCRMGMARRGLPGVPLRMLVIEDGTYDEFKRCAVQTILANPSFRPGTSFLRLMIREFRYPCLLKGKRFHW